MAAADPEKMKIPVILDVYEFYQQLSEGLRNAAAAIEPIMVQMRDQADWLESRISTGHGEIHADGSDLDSVSDAVESEVDSAQDDDKAAEDVETRAEDSGYEIPQIRRSYDELSSGYCYVWDCYEQHDDYDPHKPMSDVTETFDEAHKSLIEHVRVFHG